MARTLSSQEWIHWLEMGEGARRIRLAATLLAIAGLSLFVAWKQFHGLTTESALLQADVGRQLARGQGFTTLVNYPQTAAFLEQRGKPFDERAAYPELHHAPFYSLVVAGALRLLPAAARASLFSEVPTPPDGFRADYFLLGLNVALLWLCAWLTFLVARRLFDAHAAWAATLALLVSVGVWQQTVVANGSVLLMTLAVLAFWIWVRVDDDAVVGTRAHSGWLAALGATCGLLFLTEYSAGALILLALAYGLFRFRQATRLRALGLMLLGFGLVAAPWLTRNFRLTGHPMALASENIALIFGDPTAEPSSQRNGFSVTPVQIDLRKLANKALTRTQESLQEHLWSGGAMWLTAFFVAGWLYSFRMAVTNRLRWVFTLALGWLIFSQAVFNSGESDRLAAGWLAPLIIVFGAGFFSILVTSNAVLGAHPRWSLAGLLCLQALPLLHDALAPRRLHFQYPPYFPGLFIGMRQELENRDTVHRFGLMADVPAGVAWYGDRRVWSQPVRLRDFYAITLEQPIGELLLTPRTLDRPFFSELATRPVDPGSLALLTSQFGEWGRIYAGLFTGRIPPDFPLNAPQKLAENLYVLLNPALPPAPGK